MGKRRRAANVALAALAFSLAGCASLNELEPPPTPAFVPPDWALVEPAPLEADVLRYWTQLGDPLLSAYVEQAAARNRDLEQAAARIALARAGVAQSRARFLPRVDAAGGLRRDFGDFAEDDLQPSLGVEAAWEVDLFGRVSYDVAAARAELLAAGYSLADLQRLIIGQVAQGTINARALAVQLAIAGDTLRNQDDNLQIAEWRLQAGLVSSLDVEQARAQRAQTAATIPQLERDLAATANGISVLIGEAPGPVLFQLAETAVIPVPPEQVGFGPPAAILRQRPDVRRAEALVVADSARIGLARTQLLPLLQLTGNIGTASLGFGDLFNVITGGLFAGVRQLIFDGGASRAQVDAARAQAAASLAGWEQTVLLALDDVETAAVSLDAARDRVVLFAEALQAADNATLLARSQFQAGLIDFTTLLIAEDQLLSARTALAAAEAERAGAFVQLTQALGGGWDAGAPELVGVLPPFTDASAEGTAP